MGAWKAALLVIAAVILLGALVMLADLIRADWRQRKEAKQAEKDWRESWAALCAAAGVDPDMDTREPLKPEPPTTTQKPVKRIRERKKARPIVYNFPERGKDNEQGR